MLPPAHRMRRGADFTHTTRHGTKVSRGRVVAYVRTNEGEGALVGLIVSKAVGNSVARHRVARRLRGAMAGLLPDLPSGSRLVLRALAGAAEDPLLPDDAVEAARLAVRRSSARGST